MRDAFLSPLNWEQQMARARRAYVPEPLRDRDLVARAVRAAWRTSAAPVCLIYGDPVAWNESVDGFWLLADYPSVHLASRDETTFLHAYDPDARQPVRTSFQAAIRSGTSDDTNAPAW